MTVVQRTVRVHCFLDGVGFGGSGKRIITNAVNLKPLDVDFYIYAPIETIKRLITQFGTERCSLITFHNVGRYSDGQRALTDESIRQLAREFKSGDVIHLVAPWTIPWRYRRSVLYSYVNVYFPLQSKLTAIRKIITKFTERQATKRTNVEFIEPTSNASSTIFINTLKRLLISTYVELKVLILMRVCSRVDILNPELYEYATFICGAKKVSLTRGLASHAQFMDRTKSTGRKDKVVFLGRFERQKGIHYLIKTIPALAELAMCQRRRVEICLVGAGTFKAQLIDLACRFNGDFIKVDVFETNEIEATLRDAKIFLSLQQYSNYPSQSLIEAMTFGVLPIVTKTGLSQLMVPEGYRYLISEAEIVEKLPELIFEILSLTEIEFQDKSLSVLDHVNSSIFDQTQAKYYLELYRQLSY